MIKINAFIASRLGSQRIKYKNMLLLKEKPLFTYLTDSALKSKRISSLYINSDSDLIIDAAKQIYGNKIIYYKRNSNLGTSKTALDDYTYDFMINNNSDITIFLNPCSLFLRPETIDNAIQYFHDKKLDSCCASSISKTHCFYKNKSINFNTKDRQPRSQDLIPVHCMTSGFFIWKNKTFINSYRKEKAANFCGKFESYGISKRECIDIDNYEDLELAEAYLEKSKLPTKYKYHESISDLIKNNQIKTN